MRILKRILLTASATVFALTATVAPAVPLQTQVIAEAATMKLNKKSLTLYEGDTYKLKVTGKGKKKVKWSSTDSSVAKVSRSGNVRAVSEGTATIKAKVGKKTLKCKITVKGKKTNSYYNQLRNYIDIYGSYNDLGDKQISHEYEYNDDPDLEDATASIDMTNVVSDAIDFTVYFSYFDDDYDLSSVYASMTLNEDGKLDIIYVSLTASGIDAFTATAYNYDPSDYIKDVTDIDFEIENNTYGTVSNREIQSVANKLFAISLETFDASLNEEVGFGLNELGFTYYY